MTDKERLRSLPQFFWSARGVDILRSSMSSKSGPNSPERATDIEMRRPYALSIHPLIFLALIAAVPGHAFGQGHSVGIPEHANAKRYGSGWKCDRGYRAAREACVAFKIPENAHLDYSGNDWKCNEPYRKRQGRCARI